MKIFLSAFIIAAICGAEEVKVQLEQDHDRQLEHLVTQKDVAGLDFVLSAVANQVFGQMFAPAIYLSDTFWSSTKTILHDLISCRPKTLRISGFYKAVRKAIEELHRSQSNHGEAVSVTDFISELRNQLEIESPVDIPALERLSDDLAHIIVAYPIVTVSSYLEYISRLLLTLEALLSSDISHVDPDKPLELAFFNDVERIKPLTAFTITPTERQIKPYPNIWKFNKYGWTNVLMPQETGFLTRAKEYLLGDFKHFGQKPMPVLTPSNITPQVQWQKRVFTVPDESFESEPHDASTYAQMPVVYTETPAKVVACVDASCIRTSESLDGAKVIKEEEQASDAQPSTTSERSSESFEPSHTARHEVFINDFLNDLFAAFARPDMESFVRKIPGYDRASKLFDSTHAAAAGFSAPHVLPKTFSWPLLLDPRFAGTNFPIAFSAMKSGLIDMINTARGTPESDYISDEFRHPLTDHVKSIIRDATDIDRHRGYFLLDILNKYQPKDVKPDMYYDKVLSSIISGSDWTMPDHLVGAVVEFYPAEEATSIGQRLREDIFKAIGKDAASLHSAHRGMIAQLFSRHHNH